jgi:hypothetical protein
MRSRDAAPRPGAAYATDRYAPVLALLLIGLGVATFVEETGPARVLLSLAVVAAIVGSLRASGVVPGRMRRIVATAVPFAIVVTADGFFAASGLTVGVWLAVTAALGYSAFALVRRVLEHEVVAVGDVIAALAAYVEVALVFAFVYAAADQSAGGEFFTNGVAGNIGDFVYFSVVTITTLGFGDLAPATDLGRSLVMIETLFGQILLVVLVAYLVGSLGGSRSRAPRP